ncbi:winged helix-turn-helix transcriptional regulator [Romboutsia sp. CE17]|uniref:MarR family winged helix-turn-helix transcriptional regulator n=1 Tax=Romboutsia sp. CE17 TaxID=2724150 RepID=UPI001442DE52|nr:MarR family winged helix-turn-helix transcriptional regulator [Romboutsia sp. CE17]QJA08331.1 winged helix-turn-helix transcriptional regulator [Romboutsia sp. CE17]
MNNEKRRDNRHIGKYISQLYRKGSVFINKEVSKYGISSGQFMFLLEVYIQDGRNQEEISEKLKIDKGTTARALKKLEEQGFITRVKDEYDKRSNKVYLTDKAKEIRENVFDVLRDWNHMISQSLTEEEEEAMDKLLEKVCNNINI